MDEKWGLKVRDFGGIKLGLMAGEKGDESLMSIVVSRALEFYTQTDRRVKRKQTEGIYNNILIQIIYKKVQIRRRLVLIHTSLYEFCDQKAVFQKLAWAGRVFFLDFE